MDCSKYMWQSHVTQMQITYLCNIIMVVSRVSLCKITHGQRVDQLATIMLPLADWLMMMQLCCHHWEVNNLQQCAKILATFTISYLAGHNTVKLRLHRITWAADIMQDASQRELQAQALSGGNTLRHSPVYGRSRPKHAVSEGSLQ